MVSAIRVARKKRQAEHIPSEKAWDTKTNQWIDNPELDELIEEKEENGEKEEKEEVI